MNPIGCGKMNRYPPTPGTPASGLQGHYPYQQQRAVGKPRGFPDGFLYKLGVAIVLPARWDCGGSWDRMAYICAPGKLGNLKARRAHYGQALGVLADPAKETGVEMDWPSQPNLSNASAYRQSTLSRQPSCHV